MRPGELACWIVALMLLAVGCEKKPTAHTTPLHRAAKVGEIGQVRTLISGGDDVNAKGGWVDTTPLHLAAAGGYRDVVELLATNGADVNAKDRQGITPLQYAAVAGHYHVVELLVAKGATLTSKTREEDAIAGMVAAAQPNVRTLVQDNSAFAFDQEATVRYAAGDDLQILELPYRGHNLSMLVVLPKEIDGLR